MEKFERADPNALADFDPRTKVCTMNCGPTVGDPRSPEERRFLCPDCVTVPVPSSNRANALFSALLEFHNAFCNRDETTSLHVWNERMKAADENAVATLNAAPHAEQTHVSVPPIDDNFVGKNIFYAWDGNNKMHCVVSVDVARKLDSDLRRMTELFSDQCKAIGNWREFRAAVD